MSNTNKHQTYLGNRGYTILKNSLNTKEQEKIRDDLTVKPFAPPSSMQKPTSFSIYRESPNKFYIPRMYGLEKYGEPKNIKISNGNDIDLKFKGKLRDYQNKIINTYINESKKNGCGLLEIPCGRGKCLGYNTPILMSDFSIKPVQDICNGDKVMGDDYKERIVDGVNSGISKLYTVNQDNGISYVVNDQHILSLYNSNTKTIEDICIDDYLKIKNLSPALCDRYYGVRIFPDSDVILSKITISNVENDNRYYGFTIGGNHRFLLGDYTVTHNTVMALNIISKLKKKTIVIVHKEFLLKQWVERIEEFLPNARIGTIQGKIIDIKNKHIVIGMLQSLSMKEYPQDTFSSFGLTITDECHHISAEVFSRSLFKIVTPYMLGLSATMNRKDGLTKVIKYFMGNVVYKEEREGDNNVNVKIINYSNNDPDYSKVEYNYRGHVHYAIMIRKLCEFNHRSEFVIYILKKVIEDDKNDQIMILAHNKALLKYLFDAITHRKIASVGYYVGGMKEKELNVTKTKQVILATYAMAEEGLDIKTLSALIMATPKKDVTQSSGRILRMKHINPLIIDIVDQHDIFKRQSIQRLKFYKKCDYKIMETDINKYYKNEWTELNNKRKNTKSSKSNAKTKTKKIEDLLDIKINTHDDGLLTKECLL